MDRVWMDACVFACHMTVVTFISRNLATVIGQKFVYFLDISLLATAAAAPGRKGLVYLRCA